MTVDEIMELATILGDSRYLAGAGKASREDVQDDYCNLRTAIESRRLEPYRGESVGPDASATQR